MPICSLIFHFCRQKFNQANVNRYNSKATKQTCATAARNDIENEADTKPCAHFLFSYIAPYIFQHWTWISFSHPTNDVGDQCWCFVIKFPFILTSHSHCRRRWIYSRPTCSIVEDSLCTLEILCHWVELHKSSWNSAQLFFNFTFPFKAACFVVVAVYTRVWSYRRNFS